jgi:hypothetical protein
MVAPRSATQAAARPLSKEPSMLKYLLGAAAAFALFAAPASACDDCKNCPNKKNTTAQADKKDDKGCQCKGTDGKCQCGEKCACEHCKHKHDKKDEPKKT